MGWDGARRTRRLCLGACGAAQVPGCIRPPPCAWACQRSLQRKAPAHLPGCTSPPCWRYGLGPDMRARVCTARNDARRDMGGHVRPTHVGACLRRNRDCKAPASLLGASSPRPVRSACAARHASMRGRGCIANCGQRLGAGSMCALWDLCEVRSARFQTFSCTALRASSGLRLQNPNPTLCPAGCAAAPPGAPRGCPGARARGVPPGGGPCSCSAHARGARQGAVRGFLRIGQPGGDAARGGHAAGHHGARRRAAGEGRDLRQFERPKFTDLFHLRVALCCCVSPDDWLSRQGDVTI